MQPVTILCIGKLKENYWRDACAEYIKRLGGPGKAQIVELDEEKLPDNPSKALIDKALEKEGKDILSRIPSGTAIVPLCIEGKQISSEALSSTMQDWAVRGFSKVTFIIGSSFGLSDMVKSKGHLKLSMSPMTFPHQLARVMLLEQIYRASQIENGSRYHK